MRMVFKSFAGVIVNVTCSSHSYGYVPKSRGSVAISLGAESNFGLTNIKATKTRARSPRNSTALLLMGTVYSLETEYEKPPLQGGFLLLYISRALLSPFHTLVS